MSGIGGVNVQGDRGFPDLVLVKPPRLIFAELKVKGKPRPEQNEWLKALIDSSCAEVYFWAPADWQQIMQTLGRAA